MTEQPGQDGAFQNRPNTTMAHSVLSCCSEEEHADEFILNLAFSKLKVDSILCKHKAGNRITA